MTQILNKGYFSLLKKTKHFKGCFAHCGERPSFSSEKEGKTDSRCALRIPRPLYKARLQFSSFGYFGFSTSVLVLKHSFFQIQRAVRSDIVLVTANFCFTCIFGFIDTFVKTGTHISFAAAPPGAYTRTHESLGTEFAAFVYGWC